MKKTKITLLLLLPFILTAFSQAQIKFPDLQFTEVIKGKESSIGHWGDGKVYVIELWGTWCAPCIQNMPNLSRLQQKYAEKELVVIGYSWESPEKVKKLVNQLNDQIQYTLVNDQSEKFMKILAEDLEIVESFPCSFVIDREGKLVWSGHPEQGLELVLAQLFSS